MSKTDRLSAKDSFSLRSVESITPQEIDYDFLSSLSEDNVKKIDEENARASEERQKQIEALYPVFTREKISLEKLVPANSEWNFFPTQENGMLEELMENIAVYGQLSPAIVWAQEDGTFMILGGHTRFHAISKLHGIFRKAGDYERAKHFETMDCNVYAYEELNEIEARRILIYDNIIRRKNSDDIEDRAALNLISFEKDNRSPQKWGVHRKRIVEIVAEILGESVQKTKRRYQLRTLIPEFWPLRSTREITGQFARVLASLPAELQKHIFECRLYRNKITSQVREGLKKARTTEDVDNVFRTPEVFTVNVKTEMSSPLPDGYKPVTVFCSEEEIIEVRKVIESALCGNNSISEQTKELARSILTTKV